MNTFSISRRDFMKTSLGAGAGLMISFSLPGCDIKQNKNQSASLTSEFQPNAWIRIAKDNSVTVVVPESEMGQGVMTSLSMIIADELDADWSTVRYEPAPVDPAFGFQGTGGSTSIRHGWKVARQAGAVARKLLVDAAAQQWKVNVSECATENSKVVHAKTGKVLNYGDLVEAAALLPLPETAELKEPGDFKFIGKPMPLLDAPIKVKGEAVFGFDVKLPDMLIATIAHCPVFGGKLLKFNDAKAREVSGVTHVVALDSGVVVIATHYWAAKKGLDALEIQWDLGENANIDSHLIRERLKKNLDGLAEIIDEQGDASVMQNKKLDRVEAEYEVPFEAHATMEPMNCTVHVRQDRCDIWVPTQSPTGAQEAAKELLPHLAAENIFVHTTFLGGGFGRRLNPDFVVEAVQISLIIKKPVKLLWSRREDMQHDHYRPVTYHRLVARTDSVKNSIAWHHRITGPTKRRSAGGADSVPYVFAYRLIDFVDTPIHVPVGPWRSVGHSQNAFVVESFIDELAHSLNQDPFQFRLGLLKNSPRHTGVLRLAAEKADWGHPPAEGIHRGIAVWASFESYVAQVAEVSIAENNEIKVHRVVCVIDCGTVINPDTVKAQMDSGIVYGLTAALKGKIDIKDGAVAQSNFHDFPLLRIDEMPKIETYIIANNQSPGGVGEPGLPPIAPAVANAVFAATGKRIRKLPLALLG